MHTSPRVIEQRGERFVSVLIQIARVVRFSRAVGNARRHALISPVVLHYFFQKLDRPHAATRTRPQIVYGGCATRDSQCATRALRQVITYEGYFCEK